MKGKTSLRALIGLVAVCAIVIGVLVWPTPRNALAVNVTTYFTINWNGFDYGDADLYCQQVDDEGNGLGGWKPMTTSDSQYRCWEYTFAMKEVGAVGVKFNWIFDPTEADINSWTGLGGIPNRKPPAIFPIAGNLATGYVEAH